MEICSRWRRSPPILLDVDEVAREVVVVNQGPRSTERTTAVVRSVGEVQQFDGRLRAAPIVDEAHLHGAVDRAEELCFNGQVSVEHPPGVHGGLKPIDEGVIGHLERSVPKQEIGGGPNSRTL